MAFERLRTSLSTRPGVVLDLDPSIRDAVVAIIARPGPDLLFIRRAEFEGDPWSGHMAFPGGRVDAADESLEAAVRREVQEEVGIDLSGSVSLGSLNQMAAPPLSPQVVVTPFVFVLEHAPVLTLDPVEVAAAHWFSLERLDSKEGRGHFKYLYEGRELTLPRVDLDGERVWGITLRILDELLYRLRP